MKNKIILYFVFVLLVCACNSSRHGQKTNEPKIKTLTEISYNAIIVDGKCVKGEYKTFGGGNYFTQHYNNHGNVTEKNEYSANGDMATTRKYNYDAQNKLLSVCSYSARGTRFDSVGYVYDSIGRLNEKYTYVLSKLVHKDSSVYNAQNLEKIYTFGYRSDDCYITSYEYLPKNVMIKRWYLSGTNPARGTTYRYENGKLMNLQYLLENGKCSETYLYNAKGNLQERKVVATDYRNLSTTQIFAYEYTAFDNAGNWISRIEYEDNQPKYITERRIEYFE